jgi:hypothetical protein
MSETFYIGPEQRRHMRLEQQCRELTDKPHPLYASPQLELSARRVPTGNPQFEHARECILSGRPVTLLTEAEVAARRVATLPPFIPPKGSPAQVAAAFLSWKCARGPVQVNILMAEAKALGVSESSIRRAKKALGLKATRQDELWLWGFRGANGTP